MTDVEVERLDPRIEGEDTLYIVTGATGGGWDQKWRVWFKPVGEAIVELADEKSADTHNRSEYIPKAAEALVCEESPRLVRGEDGGILAELVVNDVA